jgi:energy-coupling factor transporter ATP-binding protein EcfA2
VVLVAHRLSTVMNADKIAVIDGGRVVEEGNHATLVAKSVSFCFGVVVVFFWSCFLFFSIIYLHAMNTLTNEKHLD